MEMEEDDPVVEEIPVFLSKELSKNLYLCHYPMRRTRDWSNLKVTNASVNGMNQNVKLVFGINTNNHKYCPCLREEIPLNMDGSEGPEFSGDQEKDEEKYFNHGIMDKIVNDSGAPLTDNEYPLGVLEKKELHCTPIQGILQFRPTHCYVVNKKKRKVCDNDDEEELEWQAFKKQKSDEDAFEEMETTDV